MTDAAGWRRIRRPSLGSTGGVAAGLLLALCIRASPVQAQSVAGGSPERPDRDRALDVSGGMFFFDRGEASAPFVALRGTRALTPRFLGELSIGVWSSDQVTADGRGATGELVNVHEIAVPVAVVDFHVQLPLASGRVRPYVGLGGGAIARLRTVFESPGRRIDPSVSGSLGLRTDLTRHVGFRGEVRLRADGFPRTVDGLTAFETTAGLTWRW